jgi:hypothetical protein
VSSSCQAFSSRCGNLTFCFLLTFVDLVYFGFGLGLGYVISVFVSVEASLLLAVVFAFGSGLGLGLLCLDLLRLVPFAFAPLCLGVSRMAVVGLHLRLAFYQPLCLRYVLQA